jgi:hypothetical protein
MNRFSRRVFFIAIMFYFSTNSIAAEKNLTGTVNKERIIHFPKEYSLGKLKIQTGIPASPYDLDNSPWGDDWEYIGQAKDDVTVPLDKKVQLLINRADSRDFSALQVLRPNDLYMLIIDYSIGPLKV